MAITISKVGGGDPTIMTLGDVTVFEVKGETGDKFLKPVPPNPVTMEQMKYPVTWFGDNSFEMKVGEYKKVYRDPTDLTKGYDFILQNPDSSRVSIIVDEDLHYNSEDFNSEQRPEEDEPTKHDHFRLYCTCFKEGPNFGTTEGKNPNDIIPVDVGPFEGRIALEDVPAAIPYKLRIKAPTFNPESSKKPRPGTFSFLGTDNPATTSLTTKFFTTFPTDQYDHCINYSADSMHYWDNGHFEHAVVTPSNNEITQTLTLANFAPEAMFTGHVNVSITGIVSTKGKVPMEVIDQRGYMIHIEYSVGQATGFRYLIDGATDKYLVNEDDKKLAAIPTYD